jgi:hypothetical protein
MEPEIAPTRSCPKSLLVSTPSPSGYQYRLLETLRAYGENLLLQAGETADRRNAHVEHFVQRWPAVSFDMQYERYDEIAALQPNITAAMDWALTTDRPDLTGYLFGVIGLVLHDQGATGELLRWTAEIGTEITNQGTGWGQLFGSWPHAQLGQVDAALAITDRLRSQSTGGGVSLSAPRIVELRARSL